MTSTDGGFPLELLDGTTKEKTDYFENKKFGHPLVNQIKMDVTRKINFPAGRSVIAIFGPTGVGKTTVCNDVYKNYINEKSNEISKDKSLIPAFWIIASASERGNFDWTEFRIRCLEECQEPLISHKVSPESIEEALSKKFVAQRKPDPKVLKLSLENAIKYRKVEKIFVDEGHHMAIMASGKRIKDQMEAVKSLTNLTNTVIVLIGTYELLDLLKLNAQLARRTFPIHFRRYRNNPKEFKEFSAVVKTFRQHLPLHSCIDLTSQCRYLFENSVGCVGVMKDWLTAALVLAWEGNKGKLGLRQLKESAYSKGVVEEMQKEIFEGETRVEEMFFPSGKGTTDGEDNPTETTQTQGEEDQVSRQPTKKEPEIKKGNGRAKPGTRNPNRDPVGEPIMD